MPLEVMKRLESGDPPLEAAKPTLPDIKERSSERALKVGRALAERRAIMFGAYWCPFCDKERQALGEDLFTAGPAQPRPLVRYVECDARGKDAEPDLCREAGVNSYPTWALSATPQKAGEPPFRLYPGFKGLRGMERLLGLPSPPADQEPGGAPRAPPVTGASGARETAVAEMLKARGAVFYGTFWCPACDAQRQLFGASAWERVPYVECDGRAEGADPARCEAAGVDAIPFWVFPGGSARSGLLTLDQLEAEMTASDSTLKASPPTAANGAATIAGTTSVVLPLPAEGEKCEDCKLPGR